MSKIILNIGQVWAGNKELCMKPVPILWRIIDGMYYREGTLMIEYKTRIYGIICLGECKRKTFIDWILKYKAQALFSVESSKYLNILEPCDREYEDE